MASASSASAASAAAAEKTADELRLEINELHRQHREITDRLRDPRGLRRPGAPAAPRRGFVRPPPPPPPEDLPAPKKRLLSAVVKLEDGEIKSEVPVAVEVKQAPAAVSVETNFVRDRGFAQPANGGAVRSDFYPRRRSEFDVDPPEPQPRVLPKDDPSVVKRNQRMFGQILGTLQKFQQEDQKLSTTEAFMRRSDSLRRAELKAREETEKLRQQEREQIAEKRRRDLTLRARVAAKAEEKKLELLFIKWAEHHKKLSKFLRTKKEPPIYYMPVRPLVNDPAAIEQQREQAFNEWKLMRRAELSEYQKQIAEQHMANVEQDLQRWQNARNGRRVNNVVNLQETMDKELETHRLEHGPKTRIIPGSNEEEDDVDDIVVEDELMDEVLDVNSERFGIGSDVAKLAESAANDSSNLAADGH